MPIKTGSLTDKHIHFQGLGVVNLALLAKLLHKLKQENESFNLEISVTDPRFEYLQEDSTQYLEFKGANDLRSRRNIFRFNKSYFEGMLTSIGISDIQKTIDEHNIHTIVAKDFDKRFQLQNDQFFDKNEDVYEIEIGDLQRLFTSKINEYLVGKQLSIVSDTALSNIYDEKIVLEATGNDDTDIQKSLIEQVSQEDAIYPQNSHYVKQTHGVSTFTIDALRSASLLEDQKVIDQTKWQQRLKDLGWALIRPPQYRFFTASPNDENKTSHHTWYIGSEIPESIREDKKKINEWNETILSLLFEDGKTLQNNEVTFKNALEQDHVLKKELTRTDTSGQSFNSDRRDKLNTHIETDGQIKTIILGDKLYAPHYQTGSGAKVGIDIADHVVAQLTSNHAFNDDEVIGRTASKVDQNREVVAIYYRVLANTSLHYLAGEEGAKTWNKLKNNDATKEELVDALKSIFPEREAESLNELSREQLFKLRNRYFFGENLKIYSLPELKVLDLISLFLASLDKKERDNILDNYCHETIKKYYRDNEFVLLLKERGLSDSIEEIFLAKLRLNYEKSKEILSNQALTKEQVFNQLFDLATSVDTNAMNASHVISNNPEPEGLFNKLKSALSVLGTDDNEIRKAYNEFVSGKRTKGQLNRYAIEQLKKLENQLWNNLLNMLQEHNVKDAEILVIAKSSETYNPNNVSLGNDCLEQAMKQIFNADFDTHAQQNIKFTGQLSINVLSVAGVDTLAVKRYESYSHFKSEINNLDKTKKHLLLKSSNNQGHYAALEYDQNQQQWAIVSGNMKYLPNDETYNDNGPSGKEYWDSFLSQANKNEITLLEYKYLDGRQDRIEKSINYSRTTAPNPDGSESFMRAEDGFATYNDSVDGDIQPQSHNQLDLTEEQKQILINLITFAQDNINDSMPELNTFQESLQDTLNNLLEDNFTQRDQTRLKEFMAKVNDAIKSNNVDINNADRLINEHKKKIQNLEAVSKIIQNDIRELTNNQANLQQQFESNQTDLQEKHKTLADLDTELKNNQKLQDQTNDELINVTDKVEQAQTVLDQLEAELKRKQQEYKKLNFIKKLWSRFTSKDNYKAHQAYQALQQGTVDKLKNNQYRTEIEAIKEAETIALENKREAEQKKTQQDQKVTNLFNKYGSINGQYQELQKEAEKLQNELTWCDDSINEQKTCLNQQKVSINELRGKEQKENELMPKYQQKINIFEELRNQYNQANLSPSRSY
ncbi:MULTISPECIES: hypothetical protein [Cysteiniphilum]|uniref:hypothetical protein n=1 Tax=Cysteiniphilum TaxID=2056696 RepID=UPI00177E5714|nr:MULTISPECIES: hypothetical protein [Cysteiniphilum]